MKVEFYIIKSAKLLLDRKLDDDLYIYLKKYCEIPHYRIDVNKFKEKYPDWKQYTFFGGTGPNGEFIVCDKDIEDCYQINGYGRYVPAEKTLSLTVPFCVKNRFEIVNKAQTSDLYFEQTKNIVLTWLKYIIENFLETAPDPYLLSGKLVFEEFYTHKECLVEVRKNKVITIANSRMEY